MITSKRLICIISALLGTAGQVGAEEISITIDKKYINLPVSHKVDRSLMTFSVDGKPERGFDIRLATGEADYWVFADVSGLKGKKVTISYGGNQDGMKNIFQSNDIAQADSIYKEDKRPQLHFSTRRGWINDPNGLVYYDGEYHLFYQHNPYEREWGNMHWGHAVSEDLIHWKELPEALYPDALGTMFSGSAVIDYNNTAGFNKGKQPAMVAAYTAASSAKQVQCIAFSHDKGRTWTKYSGNPVIDSKEKWQSHDTRDPKVFWYEPNKEWVMLLNERDGHSVYTSPNLKDWKYESHIAGFWECPELFELAVDGDKNNTKWVMYGASGTYMTGRFDGRRFTPDSKMLYYTSGPIYAAQTFNNIPESDGRRIQIGWGRISFGNMPFNGLMLLPTELTLRTTKDGVRLFSTPVRELESNQKLVLKEGGLTAKEANELLHKYSDRDCLRIKFTIKLFTSIDAGFNLYGQRLVYYDIKNARVNGTPYSPEDITSMELSADVILDRSVVEAFIDGGAFSYALERKANPNNTEGFHFWGSNLQVKELEVYELDSIWK